MNSIIESNTAEGHYRNSVQTYWKIQRMNREQHSGRSLQEFSPNLLENSEKVNEDHQNDEENQNNENTEEDLSDEETDCDENLEKNGTDDDRRRPFR
ncbi:hypothetical protein QE152_g33389 [Popillia japonica]|uniref:Uncharacterized protein n=1 Tax=Popillia japonica TaxID=7064 RepID=A0AAW1IX30_POPJA